MSSRAEISPAAMLIAVVTAFVVGVLASLAIRPSTGPVSVTTEEGPGVPNERLSWRLASSFTTAMPVVGETIVTFAENLRAASHGAIDITVYEPGEIVPALEITESIKEGKVDLGYLWIGYDQGRIPASTLIAAVPFGMDPVEFMAWWYHGGGRELGEALYAEHDVMPLLCAISGPETAGWFRSPVSSLEDIEGLKIRFAGLGGKVMQRLGASVTMIPGGEVFQALEKGAIDASEFSMPAVDAMLGFGRVARFNYFPGWHQPFSTGHLLVNLKKWQALRNDTRQQFRLGCRANVTDSLAASEAIQGPVIRDFPKSGIEAAVLPNDVLRRLRDVSVEVLNEEAANDEHFARILNSQRNFSATYAYWKQKAYVPRDL